MTCALVVALLVIGHSAAQQALLLTQHTALMNFYNALGSAISFVFRWCLTTICPTLQDVAMRLVPDLTLIHDVQLQVVQTPI